VNKLLWGVRRERQDDGPFPDRCLFLKESRTTEIGKSNRRNGTILQLLGAI